MPQINKNYITEQYCQQVSIARRVKGCSKHTSVPDCSFSEVPKLWVQHWLWYWMALWGAMCPIKRVADLKSLGITASIITALPIVTTIFQDVEK